jgi:AcrR family transcriptional regulator
MPDDVRDRIVDAASALLASGGPSAVTTRAVAADAGVQAPTIYRQFGDKDGLLQTVAERMFADQVATKRVRDDVDPVDDMRESFASQIAFGVANPGLTAIFSDPFRPRSRAEEAGIAVLRERVQRVALAGRLRVPEERAVALVHAIGVGVMLDVIGTPEADRDPDVEETAWRAFSAVALTDAGEHAATSASAAVHLRADDDALAVLSPAERTLMREWLERIAHHSST